MEYYSKVEDFAPAEYPMLEGKTYLDHGGTTIYARSLIQDVAADLMSNLYGNPHSASTPAKMCGQAVDDTREKTLRFLGADPQHFDLVFVGNATGALKLVMDSFKDLGNANKDEDGEGGGFWYGYHIDAHSSVVGIRECTDGHHHCFQTDGEVEQWLFGSKVLKRSPKLGLFAYPGQSNMTGRRLPLNWSGKLRKSTNPAHDDTYTLLDAAALATTYPLNGIFQDPDSAPDFTALSFYKIFGFPDLGALILRKVSGSILHFGRRYFGGGTVSMVSVQGLKPFFKSKTVLHESLEDGTLPFHNIIALSKAIDTHKYLYGPDPMATISSHTTFLSKRLFHLMSSLYHPSSAPLCKIYTKQGTYGDSSTQGATIAFNLLTPNGAYIPYTTIVEVLADARGIYVRSGQLCNPGGISKHLSFDTWQMQRLWSQGHRCGEAGERGTELVNGKPTGVVRVSLGAMTTNKNIDDFIRFLHEEFILRTPREQQAKVDQINQERLSTKNEQSLADGDGTALVDPCCPMDGAGTTNKPTCQTAINSLPSPKERIGTTELASSQQPVLQLLTPITPIAVSYSDANTDVGSSIMPNSSSGESLQPLISSAHLSRSNSTGNIAQLRSYVSPAGTLDRRSYENAPLESKPKLTLVTRTTVDTDQPKQVQETRVFRHVAGSWSRTKSTTRSDLSSLPRAPTRPPPPAPSNNHVESIDDAKAKQSTDTSRSQSLRSSLPLWDQRATRSSLGSLKRAAPSIPSLDGSINDTIYESLHPITPVGSKAPVTPAQGKSKATKRESVPFFALNMSPMGPMRSTMARERKSKQSNTMSPSHSLASLRSNSSTSTLLQSHPTVTTQPRALDHTITHMTAIEMTPLDASSAQSLDAHHPIHRILKKEMPAGLRGADLRRSESGRMTGDRVEKEFEEVDFAGMGTGEGVGMSSPEDAKKERPGQKKSMIPRFFKNICLHADGGDDISPDGVGNGCKF